MNLVEKQLTEKIIGARMEVSNELGRGFLEGVYERALVIALRDKGLKADAQVPLAVTFRDEAIGEFFADIVVADSVLLAKDDAQSRTGTRGSVAELSEGECPWRWVARELWQAQTGMETLCLLRRTSVFIRVHPW